jgi:hypothetical protein
MLIVIWKDCLQTNLIQYYAAFIIIPKETIFLFFKDVSKPNFDFI